MVNVHLDYSMNIGGMVLGQGIYITFRPRPFHMFNGFSAPRSIWAPLPTPNSTLYLRFSNYLLVEASALKSQKWTLCLDGNDEMGHSIHRAVNTDLKSAQKMILRDIWHFISSTKLKIGQNRPSVPLYSNSSESNTCCNGEWRLQYWVYEIMGSWFLKKISVENCMAIFSSNQL